MQMQLQHPFCHHNLQILVLLAVLTVPQQPSLTVTAFAYAVSVCPCFSLLFSNVVPLQEASFRRHAPCLTSTAVKQHLGIIAQQYWALSECSATDVA